MRGSTLDWDCFKPASCQVVKDNSVCPSVVATIPKSMQNHGINGDMLSEFLKPFIAGRILAKRLDILHFGPLASIAVWILGQMSHQVSNRFGFSLKVSSARLGRRRRSFDRRPLTRLIGGRPRALTSLMTHVKIELSQFIDIALMAFSIGDAPQLVQEEQDTLVVNRSDLPELQPRWERDMECY